MLFRRAENKASAAAFRYFKNPVSFKVKGDIGGISYPQNQEEA